MYEMKTNIDRGLIKVKNIIVKEFTLHLLDSNIYKNITVSRKVLITDVVSCFIYNTFRDVCCNRLKSLLTLDKNNYNKVIINGSARKVKVNYRLTILLIQYLKDSSYISVTKGGKDYEWSPNRGLICIESAPTYAVFNDKLKDLYKPYRYLWKKSTRENVIISRDEDKIDVTFKMTPYLKGVKEYLDGWNILSLETDIRKDDAVNNKVKRYDIQLYKVFNNRNFRNGGRCIMEGGIQQLSKEERLLLTINGKQTVVYDYTAFEPSIAYSLEGELLVGDPYSITLEGYDSEILRGVCKTALLIMLYADSNEQARSAICSEVYESFNVDRLYAEGKIPEPRIPVKKIVHLLEEKHSVIYDYFYRKSSTDLSNIGSQIMDYVLEYFMQRGVLVLPVFDEVIIEEDQDDLVVEVMKDAYVSVCGFADNCRITKEK